MPPMCLPSLRSLALLALLWLAAPLSPAQPAASVFLEEPTWTELRVTGQPARASVDAVNWASS